MKYKLHVIKCKYYKIFMLKNANFSFVFFHFTIKNVIVSCVGDYHHVQKSFGISGMLEKQLL